MFTFDVEKEVEKVLGAAAQAHTIASRTSKHISARMNEDPVFYKKLSELIKETIEEYKRKRISELEFLARIKNFSEQALNRKGDDVPETLNNREVAQTFYRLVSADLTDKVQDSTILSLLSADAALEIDEIIQANVLEDGKPIVDWPDKNIPGILKIDIGDYLIDEVKEKYKLNLSFTEIDAIADKCIAVATTRYK